MTRIAVCTRFWSTKSDDEDEKVHSTLDDWIDRAVQYADHVIIAVRVEEDKANTVQHIEKLAAAKQYNENGKKVVALPVSPWGSFSAALNALLYAAATVTQQEKVVYNLDAVNVGVDPVEYIMYQSIEVYMDKQHLEQMMSFMGKVVDQVFWLNCEVQMRRR
jgi:hypothetical protein